MDRERLKEAHQSDLTEGRINQDFVDWLQTKGMTYLLAVLVALCAYFAWVRWQHYRTSYKTEAWTALSKAELPTSLEDVASKYAGVDAVADLARLRAGQLLLISVQTGKALGAETETGKELSQDERNKYLERADRLYGEIIQADDQSFDKTLLVATALTGRAVVAESKGDAVDAKKYYEQAAKRSESQFPHMAEQYRERAKTAEQQIRNVTLPTQGEVATIQQKLTPPKLDPVSMDQWVTDIVKPRSTEADAESLSLGP